MTDAQLPEGWVWKTLGEAVEIIRGISFPKDAKRNEYQAGLIACLRTANVQREVDWKDLWFVENKYISRDNQYVQKDDILISIANSLELLGKVSMVKEIPHKATLGTFIANIRVPKECDSKYIFYQLLWQEFKQNVRELASTTTNISNISVGKLVQIPLRIPPLPVQRQIVARIEELFSELDAGVSELQTALTRLKTYRQAVLHHYLNNPDWERVKLGEVCNKIQDGSHFSPQVQYDEPGEERFPYVTAKNIRVNYMDLSKLTYVDREFHESIFQRCNPQYGDVLLTKDGVNAGDVTLNTLDEPFSLLSSVCLIKVNAERLAPSYLKYYIQSPDGNEALLGKMTGTAIKRIILKQIKESTIFLPDLETQNQIVAEIEAKLSEADAMETAIRQELLRAEKLRQSILKRAFAGELLTNAVPTDAEPIGTADTETPTPVSGQLRMF